MADLNNLSKPDLVSNYSTEVMQTIGGHILRLWTGDYSGMSGLVANMRRWIDLGGGNAKLVNRNADGSETTIFDSSTKASQLYVDTAVSNEATARSSADNLSTKKASNLSDLASITIARDNLGLGTASNVVHGSVSDSIGNLRSLPQNSRASSYTLSESDSGKHVSISLGGIHIPASIFSTGSAVTIYNNSAATQTITCGSGLSLRLAGTLKSGNRSISSYGIATILFISQTSAVISGAGIF